MPIGWIEYLPAAVGTGSDIRRNELVLALLATALDYLEAPVAMWGVEGDTNLLDMRHRGRLSLKVGYEVM